MVLKYEKDIVDITDFEDIEIIITTKKYLKSSTEKKEMAMRFVNGLNSNTESYRMIRFPINNLNLNLVRKLIEDIKENYKNDTEFYNIETKLKQLAKDNNNED